MAALLKEFPGVKATFNLTPVLLRQLDDLANGVTDSEFACDENEIGRRAELAVSLGGDGSMLRAIDLVADDVTKERARSEMMAWHGERDRPEG